MGIFSNLQKVLLRFRYPVSLPEEIGNVLGISFSSIHRFEEIIAELSSPKFSTTRLYKFMTREDAEDLFIHALKKEKFTHSSLFSYYFNKGWLEFVLIFDEETKLRRVYIQHKVIDAEKGIEIPLKRK